MTEYRFAAFTLEPVTPLHPGSGRAGMVARSHGFIPAHLFACALAAQYGRRAGGRPADFEAGLDAVNQAVRFGPALPLDDKGHIAEDWPEHPERYLGGQPHVALHLDTRSAADSALYETEYLSPRHLYGKLQGQPLRLGGGLWYREDHFAGRPWQDWLGELRLGGELKSGLGHIRLIDWQAQRADYHGACSVDGQGIHVQPKQRLWGAALQTEALSDAPLRPWLGRRYDFGRGKGGFGRHLDDVALVCLHGRYQGSGKAVFLPALGPGSRWGCWEKVNDA